jgi:hypothetical protein
MNHLGTGTQFTGYRVNQAVSGTILVERDERQRECFPHFIFSVRGYMVEAPIHQALI